MIPHLETGNVQIFSEDVSLLMLADQIVGSGFHPPPPLRRTFSLARKFRFETIVCESSTWLPGSIEKANSACNEHNCGPRFNSCSSYLNILNNSYHGKLENKQCFKLAFFNKRFKDPGYINKVPNDSLLAYCIVHVDKFFNRDPIPYVTESVIKFPSDRMGFFLSSGFSNNPIILGKVFQLKGNYFCQQNGVTNCCAQAAIKMAMKGYCPNLTAEEINRKAGIDHISRLGKDGLAPEEFERVIKELTNEKVYGAFSSDWDSPSTFVKLIYHAIESRFPVILLFTFPTKHYQYPQKQGSHAVAIIGHTFNKHSWWSYACQHYSKNIVSKYLPSVFWCDNFIVQDDNIGPYYLLPLNSLRLTDLYNISPNIFKKAIMLLAQQKKFQYMYQPLYCIIPYPKELKNFEDVIEVEPTVCDWLYDYVNNYLMKEVGGKRQKKPNNIYFSNYFYPCLQGKLLVLRTFALRTSEYLQHLRKYYRIHGIDEHVEALGSLLPPEFIWVTEISIPELFWINQKKLGEIVIDPRSFKEKRKNSVKFLRLPGLLAYFTDERNTEYYPKERDSRYPLINPTYYEAFKSS